MTVRKILFRLSPKLAQFVGETSLPKVNAQKKVNDYIRAKRLLNPDNRREIICDSTLQNLFNADKIELFNINSLLDEHFLEAGEVDIEDVGDATGIYDDFAISEDTMNSEITRRAELTKSTYYEVPKRMRKKNVSTGTRTNKVKIKSTPESVGTQAVTIDLYLALKVPDLRALLKERGLPSSGLKADLLERLAANDQRKGHIGATPFTSSDTAVETVAETSESESEVVYTDHEEPIAESGNIDSTGSVTPQSVMRVWKAPIPVNNNSTEIGIDAVSKATSQTTSKASKATSTSFESVVVKSKAVRASRASNSNVNIDLPVVPAVPENTNKREKKGTKVPAIPKEKKVKLVKIVTDTRTLKITKEKKERKTVKKKK